MSKKP